MNQDGYPVTVEHLFAHQKEAADRICERFANENARSNGYGLLFEMGCGKTLTTIAVIGRGFELGKVRRVLIVAPASVCSVWPKEFTDYAAFAYHVKHLVGTGANREWKLLRDTWLPGRVHVAVINYESTWRIQAALAEWNPDMIVCDESQRIKSPTSRQSKAMHALGAKARYRMILTGTPIQNNPLDVWSQYRFLCPEEFGASYYRFRANYAVMGGMRVNGRPVQVVGYRNLEDLHRRMYRHAMRVTKAECLDLPPQTFETRFVALSSAEQRLYNEMKRESIGYIGEKSVTADIVLTRLLILQRLTGGFVRMDDDAESTQVGTSKLDALGEVIDDYTGSEKIVIFCRFIDELKAICGMLDRRGIGHEAIYGAINQKDRGSAVERFQTDDGCRVFVAQIDTAGLGITLTAARIAVFFSPTWNYASYQQALARTHRIGQRGAECHYIHLIAPGTVDEDVMRALDGKKNLADLVVDGTTSIQGGIK